MKSDIKKLKPKLKKQQEWLTFLMIFSGETNIWERKQNKKNIQGNRTADYDISTRNKGRNIKKTDVGSKWNENTNNEK